MMILKKLNKKHFLWGGSLLVTGVILSVVWWILGSTVIGKKERPAEIYLYPGDGFEKVLEQMEMQYPDLSRSSLSLMGKIWFSFADPQTGHYQIEPSFSNIKIVHRIGKGRQTPVDLTFNNIRTKAQIAQKIEKQLMLSSQEIIGWLNDSLACQKLGYTTENILSLFIPDSYQLYWTITVDDFQQKMQKEHRRFWSQERTDKAKAIGLTPTQVSIVASMIEEESNNRNELPVIAGIYLNRLKIGMPLQSCPTIRFAHNDYTITRVLKNHLQIESPYNTYQNKGLPPGPIRIASGKGMDAVLNAAKHNYLYMCAKETLDGTHYFSSTLQEHNRYAARYHQMIQQKEKEKQNKSIR